MRESGFSRRVVVERAHQREPQRILFARQRVEAGADLGAVAAFEGASHSQQRTCEGRVGARPVLRRFVANRRERRVVPGLLRRSCMRAVDPSCLDERVDLVARAHEGSKERAAAHELDRDRDRVAPRARPQRGRPEVVGEHGHGGPLADADTWRAVGGVHHRPPTILRRVDRQTDQPIVAEARRLRRLRSTVLPVLTQLLEDHVRGQLVGCREEERSGRCGFVHGREAIRWRTVEGFAFVHATHRSYIRTLAPPRAAAHRAPRANVES
jgi:hypothetical protein